MTEVYQKKILDFIRNRDYSPLNLHDLAVALGVLDEDYEDFKLAYRQLRDDGKIHLTGKKIAIPGPKGVITGKFQGNVKGFGFVVPLEKNSHTDVFISPSNTNGAVTGDVVSVLVTKKGVRGGKMAYSGEVLEILERGNSRFVATLTKQGDMWIAKPDGGVIIEPVAVEDVSAKNVGENDKVLVEIIQYPTKTKLGRAVIIEALGKAGKYDTEIKAIVRQHGIEDEFGQECLQAARLAAEQFDPADLRYREDITDKFIITIDPETAKDFDDAISIERSKDGNWQLGVHIADVSTFVQMESPLDIEAKKRGNSVYLPGKTIPMLPEILSNGICSLQPEQLRYAKSVYITYDSKGNILDRNYENSLIKSKARLSYKQADDILNGRAEGFSGPVVAMLKDMETLAKIIEQRRIAKGMLSLDLPETEIELDNDGKVMDVHPADDSYPHTIIEMFMVEANDAVASLIDRFKVPFIRRIHPEPDSLTTKKLSRFIRICGFKVPRKLDRYAMQALIAAAKGTAAEFPINLHVLRSLSKAEYSSLHIGHFALASQNYSHFTSPIRRYADLMLHRLLQVYIEGKINKVGLEEVLPDDELKEIGRHITFTEQRAAGAEDELKKILILDLLSTKIGDELKAAVSGLNNHSVFVHCYKYGIDAMFDVKELGDDQWQYDERTGAVIGTRSGKKLEIGTAMKVKITAVSLPGRQLFVAPSKTIISGRGGSSAGRAKSGKKKPKKHNKSRHKARKQRH